MQVRLVASILAASLLATAAASPGTAERSAPLLAVSNGSLIHVDQVTLRPRSVGPFVGGQPTSWAFSPDGRTVALALPQSTRVSLYDARRLRELGAVDLGGEGDVQALAWTPAGRLLVLRQTLRYGSGPRAPAAVALVDPAAGTVLRRIGLPGRLSSTAVTRRGLVALLHPPRGIGPALIAAIGDAARVRTVSLEGVRAGELVRNGGSAGTVARRLEPGLAVDPEGRNALVLAGDGSVARVQLSTMRVTYRALPERVTAAAAKGGPVEGQWRSARWVGPGRVAFWGDDVRRDGATATRTHTGLRLLDVKSWAVSLVDPRNAVFAQHGRLLLASGSVPSGGVFGLTAYAGRSGRRLFTALPGARVYVAALAGRFAYVFHGDHDSKRRSVVDLERGIVVATRASGWRLPLLLAREGPPWQG